MSERVLEDVQSDSEMVSSPPSRARLAVLAFLCSLAFILYLDRVCFSMAVSDIQEDLSLNNEQLGYIMAAFTLAYGLFEIPTGHWGDRLGSRSVLTRIATWWSIFTALTAACTGFYTMFVVRFLFGAGEAGAYPNSARVISRWFPRAERGRAQGTLQTAALVGGASAQIVTAVLIKYFGWRWPFVIYGTLGILWASAFWIWFRDDPAEHPAANEAETALIRGDGPAPTMVHEPIPWGAVFRSRNILLLGMIMTFASFNSYVYFSWFPSYLKKGRDVEEVLAGVLSSVVLACAAAANMAGGLANDRIVKHSSNTVRARQRFGTTACFAAAILLVIAVTRDSAMLTTVFICGSIMAMSVTISNWWSCAIEISGKHVGALFGLMNGMGIAGAMGSQAFFGKFVDWRLSQGVTGRNCWDPAFFVVAGMLCLASICWWFVDTSKPVGEEAR